MRPAKTKIKIRGNFWTIQGTPKTKLGYLTLVRWRILRWVLTGEKKVVDRHSGDLLTSKYWKIIWKKKHEGQGLGSEMKGGWTKGAITNALISNTLWLKKDINKYNYSQITERKSVKYCKFLHQSY